MGRIAAPLSRSWITLLGASVGLLAGSLVLRPVQTATACRELFQAGPKGTVVRPVLLFFITFCPGSMFQRLPLSPPPVVTFPPVVYLGEVGPPIVPAELSQPNSERTAARPPVAAQIIHLVRSWSSNLLIWVGIARPELLHAFTKCSMTAVPA
jgi:hypothetical protein